MGKGHKPHSLEHMTYFDRRDCVFVHYTCNAPSQEVLDYHNIKAIGDEYNCVDNREVLVIPVDSYLAKGIPFTEDHEILKINLERLMRDLSKEAA